VHGTGSKEKTDDGSGVPQHVFSHDQVPVMLNRYKTIVKNYLKKQSTEWKEEGLNPTNPAMLSVSFPSQEHVVLGGLPCYTCGPHAW
jgi:hypothetical protein